MSQSASLASSSVGSTFATEDGPWMRYVKTLADRGNQDCEELLVRYQAYLWGEDLNVEPAYKNNPSLLPAFPCAQLLDINSDNTVRVWTSLSFRELHDPDRQEAEVNRFLSDLKDCGPDARSRLMVFHNDILDSKSFLQRPEDNLSKFDLDCLRYRFGTLHDLLLSHILGIEYDIPFSDVRRRLQQFRPHDGDLFSRFSEASSFAGLGYTHGDMLFYELSTVIPFKSTQLLRAYTLGLQNVGSRALEHNVIQFTPRLSTVSSEARNAVVDSVSDVARPSEVLNPAPGAASTFAKLDVSGPEIIARLLERGDWRHFKSGGSSNRTHWIDAILRWTQTTTIYHLEEVRQYTQNRGWDTDLSRQGRANMCCAREIAAVTQATIDQVETFLDRNPTCRRQDCENSLQSLRHLAEVAGDFATRLDKAEELSRAERQIEMTELSITESRSAIGLTVLASIFVPISLASSIFGMNLQEINRSGHSIWAFVLCAIAMWVATGAAWLAWQARRNWKVARSRLHRMSHVRENWPSKGIAQKGRWIRAEYASGREMSKPVSYFLGLRRLEKAGQSSV